MIATTPEYREEVYSAGRGYDVSVGLYLEDARKAWSLGANPSGRREEGGVLLVAPVVLPRRRRQHSCFALDPDTSTHCGTPGCPTTQ